MQVTEKHILEFLVTFTLVALLFATALVSYAYGSGYFTPKSEKVWVCQDYSENGKSVHRCKYVMW